ncbi:MAG TPA: hypothetical protein VLC09_12075 [Polyangiaceae bacterium]|nr:hypothetical protein [Polyangiaceae bacterium]
MFGERRTFLLPMALVAYVALAAYPLARGGVAWLILASPVAVGLGILRWDRGHRAGKLSGSEPAGRALLTGVGLFVASAFGPPGHLGLEAARSLALLLASAGALLAVARVPAPVGLLRGHRAAASLDATFVALGLWSLTTTAALLGSLFPQYVDLDPSAYDTAQLFAALGSLLLLSAAELRALALRGLELGVGDRSRASLSLCLAGTLIAVGAAWVGVGPADRVAGACLLSTACGVLVTKAIPDAARVTRTVRGLLGLTLLGAPLSLWAAHAAMDPTRSPVLLIVEVTLLGIAVGLAARSLARPLGPEGSRWLMASELAMDAALSPEPDVALREALRCLRAAEPQGEARPEVFRAEPSGLLSVDVAGYLTIQDVDFPVGVHQLAAAEPELTLRYETVLRAQVREPQVRPIVAWFESWGAKTATALIDDDGQVGLLVMPKGKRRSHLTLEEAQALGRLGQRMTGLLSVNSALARARERELAVRRESEAALLSVDQLRAELDGADTLHAGDVQADLEILRAAGHGPRARICQQELEALARSEVIELATPPGVDPRPWAAHLHLARQAGSVSAPWIVVDCTRRATREPSFWQGEGSRLTSPLTRAQSGTLLLVEAGALPLELQDSIADDPRAKELCLIVSRDERAPLAQRLERRCRQASVRLPSLAERAEDLHSLVLFELSRLGPAHLGRPLGIAQRAYATLVERTFEGNDEELRALLRGAVARTEGDVVTDLEPRALVEEPRRDPELDDQDAPRTRARTAPRSRRPPA